jgi:SAM-dependent methyltransferase
MLEFHADRKRYFDIQVANAEKYVIPFIEEKIRINPGMRVLEIGCGEAGVLKAFINKGCFGMGVELDAPRIEHAKEYLAGDYAAGRIQFISKDIYQVDAEKELGGLYDIIVLKDVIEHIHDQPKLIGWMKNFLKPALSADRPGAVIFFGFPPWYMPYGGHQQMCSSWLKKIPWVHLLPKTIYRWLLKRNKENADAFLEIKETGISIERFEKICGKQGYEIENKTHYLLNPIYEWKFGWKGRKQVGIVKAIPFVRNFFTTCVYYLIKVK